MTQILSIEEWALVEVMLIQSFLSVIDDRFNAIVLKYNQDRWEILVYIEYSDQKCELKDELEEVSEDFVVFLEQLNALYKKIILPADIVIYRSGISELPKLDFSYERRLFLRKFRSSPS